MVISLFCSGSNNSHNEPILQIHVQRKFFYNYLHSDTTDPGVVTLAERAGVYACDDLVRVEAEAEVLVAGVLVVVRVLVVVKRPPRVLPPNQYPIRSDVVLSLFEK